MDKRIGVIALMLALPLTALAQGAATPRVDHRQANQQQRIDQGVRSGELTGKEAAKLERGQDRVQSIEDKAKADGKVTAKERKRLTHAQDVESRRIAREKHDRQRDRDHDGRQDRKPRRAAAGSN